MPGPAILLPSPRQHDEYIVEDASDEENEDDVSHVSSCPDFTPIEMFPSSDTRDETSSTTRKMCLQQIPKKEDTMEDEKPSIMSPKKRGRPKSGGNTKKRKGKYNLKFRCL